MDSDHRKVLEYLLSMNGQEVSEYDLQEQLESTSAIIRAKTKKCYLDLEALGYILVNHKGTNEFYRISPKGRRFFWTKRKFLKWYFFENWLLIVSAIASVVAAITGIIAILKP